MGLLDLFVASSIPVLKVLLITALGSYLALDSVNILGEEARKHINNVVFYVFNPALVSSNLAGTVTYESFSKLWFMPFNILFTFVIGSLFGWILITIAKPAPQLRGLIVGCCAAGNLGNIFLVIIPAVCKEKGSPFGSPEACHSYGMAYSSLSMATGAIFLWSYVYNIVRVSSRSNSEEMEKDNISKDISPQESSASNLSEPLLSSKDQIDRYALPCTRSEVKAEAVVSCQNNKLKKLFENSNLKKLFAPSTNGAIAGFVIGLIPQIRKILIGDTAPLRVIQDSALFLGDGAIPALTLIIGGNLLKGLRGSGIQKSTIIGIVFVRYVALPLCGILIIRMGIRYGFVNDDPLYQFILLLQYAVPPAMNIGNNNLTSEKLPTLREPNSHKTPQLEFDPVAIAIYGTVSPFQSRRDTSGLDMSKYGSL
ncbi:hypothetical protein ACFE04_025580 [Oxalis oulophora]